MKKMFKKNIAILVLLLLITNLLTGCLYPQERRSENQVPYLDQLQSVQSAVDQYQEASGGLLPIKDRDMDTPIYQKYPIDFNKLMHARFLQDAPGNAFESGGVFLYVLVNVETEPTVKLIDLRVAEQLREVNLRINIYRNQHRFSPVKEMLSNTAFRLDHEKLNYDTAPYIVSPFTGNNLPVIIDTSGNAIVDYSMDIYEYLQSNDHQFETGDDVRDILVEHSVFVPAFSVPYTIDENNEPIFLN